MERKKGETVVVVESRATPVLQELPELEEIVPRNNISQEAYVTSGVPALSHNMYNNTVSKPK